MSPVKHTKRTPTKLLHLRFFNFPFFQLHLSLSPSLPLSFLSLSRALERAMEFLQDAGIRVSRSKKSIRLMTFFPILV